MKQAAMLVVILALARFVSAQTQTPPAQAGGAAAPGNAPCGQASARAGDQAEFDAYKVAAADTDGAALEKAADDFAAKLPTANCGSCCIGRDAHLSNIEQFRKDDGYGTQGAQDRSR